MRTDAPAVMVALLLISSAGCTGDSETPCANSRSEAPSELIAVVSELTIARVEDGVSLGFDLDGHTSTECDPAGCFIEERSGRART